MDIPQQLDVIRDYIQKHDLQGKVAQAVTKCVQVLPEDPNAFLATYFAEKAGGSGGSAPAAAAAPEEVGEKKLSKKEKKALAKKEGGAAKQEKKEDPAEAAAAAAKVAAKKIKGVEKEGGKKGVEIEGAADMGGLAFFCTTLMEPDGVMEHLELGFAAMNAEPPEDPEEERRGGAGGVGKMVFSAGVEFLQIVCNMPEELQVDKERDDEPTREAMFADKWVQAVLDKFASQSPGLKVTEGSNASFAKASIPANKDLAFFPLKFKDDAMAAAYAILQQKNCMSLNDSSDGVCHGDFECDDY